MPHTTPDESAPRVALVGCGRWGRHILRDLRDLGCEVVVVARSPETITRATEGGAQVVGALEDVGSIDGAVVATPTVTHAEVTEAVLGLGVPVYVEKPLTADLASAEHLAALAPDRLFVMDKWRYHPGVVELARMARERELGEVTAIASRRVTDEHRHRDVDTVWMHLPHDLAIARDILGGTLPEPRWATEERLHGERISLTASLGPAPAVTIEISCVAAAHHRELRVVFEEGVARLAGGWSEELVITRSAHAGAQAERRPIPGELPLLAELRAFAGYLRGGPPPLSGAASGVELVRLIDRLGALAAAPAATAS